MQLEPVTTEVFGRFQNLNLLVLINDLRGGRTAKWNWSSDWSSPRTLCPVAHGMPAGDLVDQLRALSQAVDLEASCRLAARQLGSDPASIYRFVCRWDSFGTDHTWLLSQIEQLWADRLADADVIQQIIAPNSKMAGVYGNRTHLEPDFQTLRRV